MLTSILTAVVFLLALVILCESIVLTKILNRMTEWEQELDEMIDKLGNTSESGLSDKEGMVTGE